MGAVDINSRNKITVILLPRQIDRTLQIKEETTTSFITLEKIEYIHCEGYLSTIFTVSGEKYSTARALKYFEALLFDYGFIRTNRNSLVNIMHITDCTLGSSPSVTLVGETKISIAKRRIRCVNDYFLRHSESRL